MNALPTVCVKDHVGAWGGMSGSLVYDDDQFVVVCFRGVDDGRTTVFNVRMPKTLLKLAKA